MSTPNDFIETEIQKILEIIEKQCERFGADEKLRKTGTTEESDPKHVNR